MATSLKRKRTVSPVPPEPEDNGLYEVECILNHREVGKTIEFFVKWAGWPEKYNSWEPMDGLVECRERIIDYVERRSKSKDKMKDDRIASKLTDSKSTRTIPNKPGKGVEETHKKGKSVLKVDMSNPSLSPTVRLQRATYAGSFSSEVKQSLSDIAKGCQVPKNISRKRGRKFHTPCTNVFSTPSPSHSGDSASERSSPEPLPVPDVEATIASHVDLTDKKEEDDPKVVTVITVMPEGKEIYKIHGAVNVTGNLTLLVEWDTDERDLNLVDSKLMNSIFPGKVIEFYEKNLRFQRKNNEDDEDTNLRSR